MPSLAQTLLCRREFEGTEWPERKLRQVVSRCPTMVQRMTLERTLDGHNGCVNTCSFNPSGDILISGSDDLRLILWDWQTGRKKLVLDSGHRNNVFQARILPQSNDRTLVSCAADGQVRLTTFGNDGAVRSRKRLAQHRGRAHKLTLQPDCPQAFFSCGEDGEVKFFDLRVEDSRAVSQMLVYKRLGDISEINAVHANPARPCHLAVCGSDQYVRIYDTRRLTTTTVRSGAVTLGPSPVHQLCPEHMKTPAADSFHVTCVQYSQDGHLLATYNYEDIYLFQPPGQQQPVAQSRPSAQEDDPGGAATEEGHKEEDGGQDGFQQQGLRRRRTAAGSGGGTSREADQRAGGDQQQAGDMDHVLQKFTGHRNVQTVKGVSFFGASDEYVVSGSDCGHVFVWGREDGRLRQLLKGDQWVVNCLEPHPFQALTLATSGIENDVKIWSPTAEPRGLDADLVQRVTSGNRLAARRAARRVLIDPEQLASLLRLRQARRRRREEEEEGSGGDGAAGSGRRRRGRGRSGRGASGRPSGTREEGGSDGGPGDGESESGSSASESDDGEQPIDHASLMALVLSQDPAEGLRLMFSGMEDTDDFDAIMGGDDDDDDDDDDNDDDDDDDENPEWNVESSSEEGSGSDDDSGNDSDEDGASSSDPGSSDERMNRDGGAPPVSGREPGSGSSGSGSGSSEGSGSESGGED